jgi:hypothetical protein
MNLTVCILSAWLSAVSAIPVTHPVSIDSFLATAYRDSSVISQKRQIDGLSGRYDGLPFVDNIEFRFQNRAWNIQQQRYTLRLEPRGIGETGAGRHYTNSQSVRNEQNMELLVNTALTDRYANVLDLMEQKAADCLNSELMLVYEDRIKVLESKKYDPNFDLTILIETEQELSKLHSQNFEKQSSIKLLQREATMFLGDSTFTEFDTSGFVSIDSVISFVERTQFVLDTNNVYLKRYRREFELDKARFDLDKAENRRYISYTEFSYDNGDMRDEIDRKNTGKYYDMKNAYAVEIGVSIPDVTLSRYDMTRRKAAFLSSQAEYEGLKRSLQKKMERDVEDIRSFIGQYRYLLARENEVDAEASLKKYMEINGADPLVLLSIKEGLLKNAIKLMEVRFGILRNYINVLDVTGLLSKKPLVNYLSGNKK